MSSRKSRHQLMQALLRSSPLYSMDPELARIELELTELGRCTRLQPVSRQRLLQIIHAGRAIDTYLSRLLIANGINPATGIGGKLHQLKSLPATRRGYLSHSAASAFEISIARKRNRYAHLAGAFPNSTQEVDQFVGEVHSCLCRIV